MNNVILAIRAVKARKTAEKIEPTHAILKDLIDEGCTMPEIRKTVELGKIGYGRTLNSHYFFEK
jgi:hypothetical protein